MSYGRIGSQLSEKENKAEELSEVDRKFLAAFFSKDYNTKCSELLEMGANIDAPYGTAGAYWRATTALTWAVNSENTERVAFLLKHKANTAVFDLNNQTPLMSAAFNLNVDIVKLLLEAKTNPNTQKWGTSAMDYVFFGLPEWLLKDHKPKCEKIVSLLMEHGFTGDFDKIRRTLVDRGHSRIILAVFDEIISNQKKNVTEKPAAPADPVIVTPASLSPRH